MIYPATEKKKQVIHDIDWEYQIEINKQAELKKKKSSTMPTQPAIPPKFQMKLALIIARTILPLDEEKGRTAIAKEQNIADTSYTLSCDQKSSIIHEIMSNLNNQNATYNNWPVAKKKLILVRKADDSDFEKLIQWTNNPVDDWALTLADFQVWRKSFAERASFLAAVDQKTLQTVGFCAGVKHGRDMGFIGMYYVLGEYRGCGVGNLLWKNVTEYLRGRNLCLASVPSMIAKYRDRNSFKCSENQRIKIACGLPKNFHHIWNMERSFDSTNHQNEDDDRIFKIAKIDEKTINEIFKYDFSVCGVERKAWCRNWLMNHRHGRSLVAVEKSSQRSNENEKKKAGPKIFGFGQIREVGRDVLKIGPLYADDVDVARQLLINLLAQFPDVDRKDVHTSFAANDQKTEKILNELGFEILSDYFEILMYTKRDVNFDRTKMFFFADSEVNFV
uniref:N-acetyltransferase domain-containing protein n=1 Tax=Romanomermis culicivorax TaxID=13658 RepID=A0A915HNU7_ROMCU